MRLLPPLLCGTNLMFMVHILNRLGWGGGRAQSSFLLPAHVFAGREPFKSRCPARAHSDPAGFLTQVSQAWPGSQRHPPLPRTRGPCSGCCFCAAAAASSRVSPPSTHRFVVLFNPLEQERLSVVSLLVNSPRVRVLSEAGQPLSVQISAHWSSATNLVPDVYQVRQGSALPAHQYLSRASLPTSTCFPLLCCALLTPQGGGRWLGEKHCPKDSPSWDLSILKRMARTLWS